jgi:histidine phosphotransferase ChpT
MDGRDAGGAALALRLAHLLATRLCHDLSSPLGGLLAALGELPADAEAGGIAVDITRALCDRIALLRAAWGTPPPPMRRDDLVALARGLPNASRLRLDVDDLDAKAAFSPIAARLLANLLLLAAESLPGGGTLVLSGAPGGVVVARFTGARAAWPRGLGAILASAAAAEAAIDAATTAHGLDGPRAMQAPLTALLAHAASVPARLLLAAEAEAAPPLSLDFAAHPAA